MDFQFNINRRGKVPVYLQIRDQMKQQIMRGQIPADTQLPNIEIIASLAGCSIQTADFALKALVEDGICYRRPKQGTFVSKAVATKMRHICGIWSVLRRQDLHQNLLTSMLVSGAMKVNEQTSIDVTLLCDHPEDTIRFYDTLSSFDFRGLLVVDPENFSKMLSLAAEFPHIRFVMLNYFLRFPEDCPKNVFSVTNADRLGAFHLMQHYVSIGVRKLGYYGVKIVFDEFPEILYGLHIR